MLVVTIDMFYKSVRIKGNYKVSRFRVTGEGKELCKYASEKNEAIANNYLIEKLESSLKTRYLKPKKAKNKKGDVLATFTLICADGSPSYIGVQHLKNRNTVYIRVVVGQAEGMKRQTHKINLSNGQFKTVYSAFLAAINWLSLFLKLNSRQQQSMIETWPYFIKKYDQLNFAKIPLV